MNWRLADSLLKLRSQVNAQWPNRRKDSDGTIGDPAHAARKSGHNPNSQGVVDAMDITHDPLGGFNSYAFADSLMKNKDPRIEYVISNGRIGAGGQGPSPWVWRKYTGTNKHDHHVHVQVRADKKFADDVSNWKYDVDAIEVAPKGKPYIAPPPTLRKGMSGPDVRKLQTFLGVKVDGAFGDETERNVRLAQAKAKIHVDGICGPLTWAAIGK